MLVSLGICVLNTPDVLTDATADFAFALMLAVARRLGQGERLVRAGQWQGWAPDLLLGQPIAGRRLGIVGLGLIGRAMARRAVGFGMQVSYVGGHAGPKYGANERTLEAGPKYGANERTLEAGPKYGANE